MGQLARTASKTPVWLCHGITPMPSARGLGKGLGAKLIPCALKDHHIDAADLLQQLGQAGLTSVFCEGGAALAASLLAE